MTETTSRQEQKGRTREALLETALRLSGEHGFAQVSLRNVAKESGVVPTTFYRHFGSMGELGLALVEQSFAALRAAVREAQRDPDLLGKLLPKSVDILVDTVKQNRAEFAFVARERLGGSPLVRAAIQRELEMFISELAVTLSRVPNLRKWKADDVMTLSGLFVRHLVYRAERVLELPEGNKRQVEDLKAITRRELRMLALGVANFKSR